MISFVMIASLHATAVSRNSKFINKTDSCAHIPELEGKLYVPLTSYPVCP